MVVPATDRYLVASLEHEAVLRACLHRYARNAADVDELLRQTWAQLLAAGKQPREEIHSIRAFALTVARNVAQSWLRHRRVVPIEQVADLEQLERLNDSAPVDEIASTQQELALLTQAVAGLPARCRRVFTLRKVYGLSRQEIAAELEIPEDSVDQHLARGVRPGSAQLELEASRWLAARDADARPDAAFERWLDADIRHRVTYLKLEAAWLRSDRLRDLRPLDRDVDADLLRPPRRHWTLAIAASVVLALAGASIYLARTRLGWQHYETRVGGFSRVVLEDGSVIDLNTDSEVRVRMRAGERDVQLVRGEGRFQVAHDASRPFVVAAANADVRAVGTAFSVRLRDSKQVDVLVSEGSVAVAAEHVAHAPPVRAGEAAEVLPDRMSVRRVEPQQLERRLAWTTGRLQFRGETLGEAVLEFNRYNRRQLRIADPSLAPLRVGGTFDATDPDGFATELANDFQIRVESPAADAIVLLPRWHLSDTAQTWTAGPSN